MPAIQSRLLVSMWRIGIFLNKPWLDRLPLPWAIAVGAVLGLGLGLPGLFYLRSPGWLLLWGGAVGCPVARGLPRCPGVRR